MKKRRIIAGLTSAITLMSVLPLNSFEAVNDSLESMLKPEVVYADDTSVEPTTIATTLPPSAATTAEQTTVVEMPDATVKLVPFYQYMSNEEYVSDLFTYTVNNEQVTITKCQETASGEITIPETIGDYPVVSIRYSAFANCKRITAIILPESVTSVGNYAFKGCTSLSSVELGGVQEMGYSMFDGCTVLTSLTIPKTLKSTNCYYSDQGPLSGSSITSVTFEEGIANIPAYICSGAASLTSVTIPEKADTIDGYTIGECAFYNTSLSAVKLPESLTAIGRYAFYGCKSMKSINISENLKTVNESAFEGCTRLMSVTLPKSVTNVGNYAFKGCTSLSSVELGGVQEMGYSMFDGCTALTSLTIPKTLKSSNRYYSDQGPLSGSSITSVTFEEGIANIPSYICSGAASLTSVTIPEKADTIDGYTIGEYAFYKCPFLSEVNLPNSITSIGRYAFSNCSNLGVIRLPSNLTSLNSTVFQNSIIKNVQISVEDTLTALVLIDNEIPYTADKTGIKDSSTKYLDRNATDYHATASTVSSAGMVTLALNYDFKSNAKRLVSDMSLKIKLPSAVTVISGSVRIDGTAVDYSEDDGYLIIPVSGKSGSVRFSVKPNDAEYLMSYAQVVYKLNGSSKTETIGIVNMAAKLLTINVPDETSTKLVKVNGVTSPKEQIDIYLDDKLVESCTASAVGNYSANVLLSNVSDGAVYKIEAKVKNPDDSDVSVLDYVTYNSESIKLTKFDMYFRNNKYDLIKLNGTSPVISWASNNSYSFTIDFNYNKKLDVVKVVSTKGNEIRTINAVYDAANDYYVATGFYNYVPGTISVEYKKLPDTSALTGSTVEIEDNYTMGDAKNVNGYMTKLTLDDGSNSVLYCYEEYETNAKLEKTDSLSFYSENGESYYISKDDCWFYRDNGIFLGRECYIQNDDGTYDAYRYGIGDFVDSTAKAAAPVNSKAKTMSSFVYLANESSSSNKKNLKEQAKKVADAGVDKAKKEYDEFLKKQFEEFGLKDYYEKSKVIYDILNTNVYDEKTTEDALYVSLNSMIDNVDESSLSSAEKQELIQARAYLNYYKLNNTSATVNKVINKYIDQSFALSGDIIVPGSSKLNSKFKSETKTRMKEAVNAMDDAEKKISDQYLSDAMKILTKKGLFGGDSLLEKMVNNSMKTYESASVNFTAKTSIDPSGYVYEGVKSNRLSGVEATIYYKENEDAESVIWDASEYDQKNPLYSDANGDYAWDVPEGLWQVKFVKDGYETAYSEWLPVPPEQLEVNVGMTSKATPSVEFINAVNNEIDIVFSQYVDVSTVNKDTVKFTINGKTVTGVFEAKDVQESAADNNVNLAKEYHFITEDMISGKVECSVKDVVNYASVKMKSEFSETVKVVKEITGFKADDSVTIAYNESNNIIINAVPGDAASGKKLLLNAEDGYVVSIPESVVFDDIGTATIPVKALLPGQTTIQYTIEGTSLSGSMIVISAVEAEKPEVTTPDPPTTTEPVTTTTTKPITTTTTTTVPDTTKLLGDVNGDNKISVADVVLFQKYLVKKAEFTEEQWKLADLNNDGTVNVFDLVILKRRILKG